MPKKPKYDEVDRFKSKGHEIVIRTIDDRTEIVFDGEPHEVKFLDNGRPWTRAFVNVMATSVRDLAERWIAQKTAQEAHWAEVDKQRRSEAAKAEKRGAGS